jgi:hypothetical protein
VTAFVTAAVGAIAVLTAALVTAFVGPAWKLRHDRRRDAAEVVARYSRPLMQAAYELQSRIYNIDRLRFFTPNSLSDAYRRSYAETSTLWLISQYLGWVEILRREVQFLDLGDIRKTRLLRDRLPEVADSLATDRFSDPRFQIFVLTSVLSVSRQLFDDGATVGREAIASATRSSSKRDATRRSMRGLRTFARASSTRSAATADYPRAWCSPSAR